MSFSRIRIAVALSLAAAIVAPLAVLAQTAPYSQVVITTQVAAGMPALAGTSVVTVYATNPTTYGVTTTNSPQVSYASNFSGDIHTVNFVPGSYSVTAGGSNYYYSYSPDCSGFTPLSGTAKFCTITLSTTPPPSVYPCTTWYGSNSCTPPTVFAGPYIPTQLSCSPAYQTVAAGQAATFTASGGGQGGYNWTTADRTFLNVGTQLTTVFQTNGTQTVNVSNGVQNATCTVNVGGTGAAVSIGAPVVYAGNPSVTSHYVPAYLPNTGFGPKDSAMFALALVMLLGASIFVYPYVRKAFAIVTG